MRHFYIFQALALPVVAVVAEPQAQRPKATAVDVWAVTTDDDNTAQLTYLATSGDSVTKLRAAIRRDRELVKARVDILREPPAAVRFLSIEPLLENMGELDLTGIDLIIFGGESGPDARPCDLAWIRDGVRQCKAAGVSAFVKQAGANVIDRNDHFGGGPGDWPDDTDHGPSERFQGATVRVYLRDSHGGDWSEWPEDLRVREMPRVQEPAS